MKTSCRKIDHNNPSSLLGEATIEFTINEKKCRLLVNYKKEHIKQGINTEDELLDKIYEELIEAANHLIKMSKNDPAEAENIIKQLGIE